MGEKKHSKNKKDKTPENTTQKETKEQDKKESKKLTTVILIIISIILIAQIAFGAYLVYKYISRKFQDAVIEIGTEEILPSNFLRDEMFEEGSTFVTDISQIDLNKVGEHEIEIAYNGETEKVKLILVDTTKPEVKFRDITKDLDYVINPDDFIEEKNDLSEMTVEVPNPPEITKFDTYMVNVVVKDAQNNITEKECKLNIEWLKTDVVVELGNKLTKEELLVNPERDKEILDQAEIDEINEKGIGEYTIKKNRDGNEYTANIKIQDTTAPTLELNDVSIYNDEKNIGKEKFIKSAKDASGDVTTTMLTKIDYGKIGNQTITIKAEDKYGNVVEKTANLTIKKDTEGPKISGLGAMTVKKNATINYEKGVKATDAKDGKVSFSVDSSKVNTGAAGTYYAIYTATDKSGNKTTSKRKITVNHDQADINALVKKIASGLGSNVEELRDYCRNKIKYSHSYGDNDPIWFGFNNWNGNCYVHAMCFQALLRERGYETKLIWVTNKTHYWNLVKINGVWRHMDSTPDSTHRKISIMTDEQRLSTLKGRDWDHSAWPACN